MINFKDKLTTDEKSKIDKLIESYDKKTNEFEISFFSSNETSNELLSMERFDNLNIVLKNLCDKNKFDMENNTMLDIILSVKKDNLVNYRITINGIEKINEYLKMLSLKKNELIFTSLIDFVLLNKDNKDVTLIKKVKDYKNYVTIKNYFVKIKLDEELQPTDEEIKKIKNLKKNYKIHEYDIIYRLKMRNSYILKKEKNIFRVDMTNTKQTINVNDFADLPFRNEIELECEIHDKKLFFEQMGKTIEFIIKVIQQSDYITTKDEIDNVLLSYRNLLNIKPENTILYGRKPVSLEIHHVIDNLTNRYSVTDKADGKRNLMITMNNKCYLISSNLIVTNLGLEVSKKYNNSIVDGEYIFLKEYNKYLYMIFDCLMINNNDVREEKNFMKRIENVNDLVEDINKTNYTYKSIEKIDLNDIEKVMEYHEKELIKFYDDLMDKLEKLKHTNLVRRKYFIEPNGIRDNEIFKYANMMWNLYETNKKLKCPYDLDGLIFQGINQSYTIEKYKNIYPEYKWKPAKNNSIDFYIEFEKDMTTKKVLTVYNNVDYNDDSVEPNADVIEGKLKDRIYKICNLYNGVSSLNGVETPQIFNKNPKFSQCHLYIDDDGNARSMDGKIINDKTVVEFYYEMNENIDPYTKWVPLKTRYDKTEQVMRYKVQYGNSLYVAEKVWKSILNPVTMEQFSLLANNNTYEQTMNRLKGTVIIDDVIQETRNAYYQRNEKLGRHFRRFQNFVKSLLIYTYMNYLYNDYQNSILDLSCGVGGDINKFFYATAEFVVGIDLDLYGLTNLSNGAMIKYEKMKKKIEKCTKNGIYTGNSNKFINI